jgi:prepilin-type N-terminal cleavage/methylation domain-containing protein
MKRAKLGSRLSHDRFRAGGGGFTLIELLVVVFIMAALLSILVPALVSARSETKSFVCMDHMRAAAFEFRLFADPGTCQDRGDSARLYGQRFSAMDFQESLYETCEFWSPAGTLPRDREFYRRGQKPIICPAGPSGLARYHGQAASSLTQGGVAPKDKVSYALNRRLIWAPATVSEPPIPVDCFVTISKRILDHPYVPLMFDVAAGAAVKAHQEPFFSAPPSRREGPSVYDDNRYWFPSMRHHGRTSVGFVGGHVISTDSPLSDPSWDWDYHPEIGGTL